MKLGIWLIRLSTASQRQQAQRCDGNLLAREGSDPCQLQIDALDAAAVAVDVALATLQERAIALMECQMQQNER